MQVATAMLAWSLPRTSCAAASRTTRGAAAPTPDRVEQGAEQPQCVLQSNAAAAVDGLWSEPEDRAPPSRQAARCTAESTNPDSTDIEGRIAMARRSARMSIVEEDRYVTTRLGAASLALQQARAGEAPAKHHVGPDLDSSCYGAEIGRIWVARRLSWW